MTTSNTYTEEIICRWISVKDKLPDYGKSVLVAYNSDDVCFNHRTNNPDVMVDNYDFALLGYDKDVKYWMEVPKVPSEKNRFNFANFKIDDVLTNKIYDRNGNSTGYDYTVIDKSDTSITIKENLMGGIYTITENSRCQNLRLKNV